MSLFEETVKILALKDAELVGDLIRKAINHAVGHTHWTHEDAAVRGRFVSVEGQPGRIFYFDGKAVLWIGDVSISSDSSQPCEVKAKRDYRIIN